MTDTLQIRLVRPAEYDAVAALTRAAYEDEPDGEYHVVAGRERDRQVWVAADAATGELLGAVTTAREGGLLDPGARGNELGFSSLAVAPAARGRGVGRRLVEHVLELARTRGKARVVTSSAPQLVAAHGLYRRLGFRRLHERETHVLDEGRVPHVFALDIGGYLPPTPPALVLAVELGAVTQDPAALRTWTRWAEDAGFALATFADVAAAAGAGAGIEAGSQASYAALITDRIGLAPTLAVTTAEPFHLATQLASLDHASSGRAAWVVASPADADALATIGAEPLTGDRARQEAADAVEVARRLWDSWQDDAVIKDVATGRFVDNDRLHRIDFHGDSYDIVGPLITPRPLQGQVVVIADVALGLGAEADVALALDADAVERAKAAGVARVFADLEAVLAGERAVDALVADLIRLADHVDGVRLRPRSTADLDVLADQVLPRLYDAGLHRPLAPGATLRESLGLPRPANRFAAPA